MVSQVVHIPTINALSHLFEVTYLYDVSSEAKLHSRSKVAGNSRPQIAQSVQELCSAPEVELVLIASHHALHASEALLALEAGKYVFIEKPIALTLQDVDTIITADAAAGGSKVFIGYMRRYAGAFLDAVKEVQSIPQIRYARVRDIIGPNSTFVAQSGMYPRTFGDYKESDSDALRAKTDSDMKQALEGEVGVEATLQKEMMWNMLSILGSHDLSAMRELLGMPEGVIGFSPCKLAGAPFWRYVNAAVPLELSLSLFL